MTEVMSVIGLRGIDHIAIAVWSIEEAVELFCDLLGGEFILGGDDERLGIRTVQFRLPPGMKIELMQPIRPDSYLQRYLEKHGQGFHHMTIFVEDVEKAIVELEARGFEVVDTNLSSPQWRETFVRPTSSFGTLLQIADTNRRWDMPLVGITLEDVLAGRVVWRDDWPCLRRTSDDGEKAPSGG